MPHKEIALKVEHFYHDEDRDFRISSKKEMRSILQHIAEHGTRVALYYAHDHKFVLTALLGVDEQGMWLDVGPYPPDNKQLLLADRVTFVGIHRHVKVQFTAHEIESGTFENNSAFYIKLPEYLLRLQRREYFRMTVPAVPPVKCIIPVQPENPAEPATLHTVQLANISGGGVGVGLGLLAGANETLLQPGKVFPGCKISIPGIGNLTVTLEVRGTIKFSGPHNAAHTHVGCQFVQMDNQTSALLQRYIARLQSESLVKQ
jgi:c-di-GMP-binding flagellar brake protein YcgR